MATVVLLVVGSLGALLSWFLATNYLSVQQELGVFLALGGFVGGALAVPIWRFLKIRIVRWLLQYDGWFLHPRRPINKLWVLLVMALLGRKDKGSLQYQDYLPSYPLPSLKNTCKKYLESVQPLLTEEDYSKTKLAAEKFLKKDGSRLQWILRLRALRHRNWLHDWWRDYIYLKQRTPIPFNSNYYATSGTSLPTPSQLDRAAMLLHSGSVYPLKVWKGQVTNQRANNVIPFCMDGTKSLVMSCRVPGVEIDRAANYVAEKPRHVVILRHGKFYQFDIMSPDGRPQSPLGIRRSLEKVVEMAGDDVDHRGVCSFTALPRAKWAEVREKMRKKEVNRRTLRAIESSGVVLSLETDYVDPSDFPAQAQYWWHGRIHNRWFDKCINISVCEGGAAGANIEHSMLDALYPGQHWEYMMTDEEYDETGHVLEPFQGHYSFEVEEPVHLQWDLEGLEDDLEQSKANLTHMISDSDLLVITTYGKKIPKQCKLSPDGWFQMAIQLTYYRLHKKFVLTYESATTRFYYKGRTETIRPVSNKSVQFCKAFDDPDVPTEEVKTLLKASIQLQTKYKMEAMRGQGVDRHLFGLYCVAKGTNMDPLPDLFTDKAFTLEFLLSTSQTPVRYTDRWKLERSALIGGFGTVTDDGYGISYLVYEDYVNWSIHSKHSSSCTNSRQFADTLMKTMEDMRKLYGVEDSD